MRAGRIFILVVMLLILLPYPAAAQADITFESLDVAIWPEYDRPDVLVIYRASLDGAVTLPAEVTLQIPVEQPNAVAMKDMDGSLVNLNYTTEKAGNWTKITFATPVPDFQLEYYDPGLTKNGAERSFSYRWSGGYAVKALSVSVLQPVGATEMKIIPNLGSGEQGSDGLTYYNYVVGELRADTDFKIDLTYQKADDALSFESQVVAPVAPVDSATSGRRTMEEMLPWVLGGVGLALIVGGVIWYWRSGRVRSEDNNRRRRHASVRTREADEPAADAAVYCHQCGKRAGAGDAFCRTCGTKLRL